MQTAVDTEHHLIVENDVINDGVDRSQLSTMAKKARSAMGVDDLTAISDRGYFKSEEILACHEVGITVIVPKTMTSIATANGRFGKADFIFDAEKNEYLMWFGITSESRNVKMSITNSRSFGKVDRLQAIPVIRPL